MEQSAAQSAVQLLQAEAALQQAAEAESAAEAAAKEAALARPQILAPGWDRSAEPRTGRPYFVNGATQRAVWDPSPNPNPNPNPSPSPHPHPRPNPHQARRSRPCGSRRW